MLEDSVPGQEFPALTQVGILLRSPTSDGLCSSLFPLGCTQSAPQQLPALILSVLLMPQKDFTEKPCRHFHVDV